MRKLFVFLLAGLVVSGCALPPSADELRRADFGPYPSNYEARVSDAIKARLKDPDSAHISVLNQPKKMFDGAFTGTEGLYGWVVCANVNAKNSYGGYAGNKIWYVMLRGDQIVLVEQSSPHCQKILAQ